ncbi:hypothetical protein UPYG_G00046970 [Umbra pygmaea]|uniref:Uncharacterized protein n=1 Tax=Umbra pygmaea TaxID=75934 RepID=A0ABD0XR67_UMBPY
MGKKSRKLLKKHNAQVRENRKQMKRFIACATFLGTCHSLAFRYINVRNDHSYDDQFKSLCKLISNPTADEYMKKLEESDSFPKFDDLIACTSEALLSEIKAEIRKAPYFSLKIDEGQDASSWNWKRSIMVRYVDDSGSIQERFLGFHDDEGQDAQAEFELIRDQMSDFDCEAKLVAQSYDSRAVSMKELNVLTLKVKEMAPHAIFVNSYSHSLSTVLSDGDPYHLGTDFFCDLMEFKSFVSEYSRLFSNAWTEMNGHPAPLDVDIVSVLLSEIADNYHQFYDTLNHIGNDMDWLSLDITHKANTLVSQHLEDFGFAFQLLTYNQVFPEIEFACDTLRFKALDVAACKACIEELIQHIQSKKSDSAFDIIYQRAETLAHHPCESLMSMPNEDPRVNFKALYHNALEVLTSHIQNRYAHLDDLKFLELLDPAKFSAMNIHFPTNALEDLAKVYGDLFDMDRLGEDLKAFYAGKGRQQDSDKLCDWIQFIRFQQNHKESLPELYKLMCLVATIGVISAGMEEENPCMKRIQDFVKETRIQGQLQQNMAVMFIEEEQLRICEELRKYCWYDKVTNLWAKKTKREDEFITKTSAEWSKDQAKRKHTGTEESQDSSATKQGAGKGVETQEMEVVGTEPPEDQMRHVIQSDAEEAVQLSRDF